MYCFIYLFVTAHHVFHLHALNTPKSGSAVRIDTRNSINIYSHNAVLARAPHKALDRKCGRFFEVSFTSDGYSVLGIWHVSVKM